MHKTLHWRPSHLESKPVSLQMFKIPQGHWLSCRVIVLIAVPHTPTTLQEHSWPRASALAVFSTRNRFPPDICMAYSLLSLSGLCSNVTSSLNPYQIIWFKIANLLSFSPPNNIPYPSFLFCSMVPIMWCVTYFLYSLRFYRMPLSIIAQATVKQKLLTDFITILSLPNRTVPHIL